MIQISVKNPKGEKLEIRPNNGYQVIDAEGLAELSASISSSSVLNGDGTIINSVRADERNIVLYVKLLGDIEANRIKLRKYFPLKGEITLYLKTNYRDVYITGVVESNECPPFTQNEQAQISIICADPYFKDVSAINTQFSGVVAGFSFPFAIPVAGMEFSTLLFDVIKNIPYEGDVETGCIIELYATGTVVNPTLYNALTREIFAISVEMQHRDKITINTNKGQKSVTFLRDGVATNIINKVKRPADWFTLTAGDNVFTYDCEEGMTALQLTIKHNESYEGI